MSFKFVCQSCGYAWTEEYATSVMSVTEGDCPCCEETVFAAGSCG